MTVLWTSLSYSPDYYSHYWRFHRCGKSRAFCPGLQNAEHFHSASSSNGSVTFLSQLSLLDRGLNWSRVLSSQVQIPPLPKDLNKTFFPHHTKWFCPPSKWNSNISPFISKSISFSLGSTNTKWGKCFQIILKSIKDVAKNSQKL